MVGISIFPEDQIEKETEEKKITQIKRKYKRIRKNRKCSFLANSRLTIGYTHVFGQKSSLSIEFSEISEKSLRVPTKKPDFFLSKRSLYLSSFPRKTNEMAGHSRFCCVIGMGGCNQAGIATSGILRTKHTDSTHE